MTRYQQIAEQIHELLKDCQTEDKLPTVRTLMQQFSVSQATIDRSLAELENQGVILRKPGYGYYLAPASHSARKHRLIFCFCYQKKYITNPLYGAMLAEFTHQAMEHNYSVSVMAYDETRDINQFRDYFQSDVPECCILLGYSRQTFLYALRGLGIKSIQLYPNFVPDDAPAVLIDNRMVIHLLFEHLAALGHRKIAMLHGQDFEKTYMLDQEERMDSFYREMQERGFPLSSRSMIFGGFDTETGYEAARKILAVAPDLRPTAIIANDYNAAGVYRAATELGLRIPEDLSVVGIDNLPGSQALSPMLTTIDIGWTKAVKHIFHLLDTPQSQDKICRLPVTLISRSSTAPATEKA